MSDVSRLPFLTRARHILDQKWMPASQSPPEIVGPLPNAVQQMIERCINSRTKTYRYVLPTQILAKLTDPSLDCRSVQATSGLQIAFDARSLCDGVIVPFDRTNHGVLGGSAEPYANNPLRIPAIIPSHRSQQRDKKGFDDLTGVLDFVQAESNQTETVFEYILATIARRLISVHVVFPVPNRSSLAQTQSMISQFLHERTGGLRLQAIAVSLFKTIGKRFGAFVEVRRSNINAADASTGGAADIECMDELGNVMLAVEVKDRELRLRHTQDKLPSIREKGISELLFIVQGGIAASDEAEVLELINREFAAGQNIYVSEFERFLHSCLILFGERGRRELLEGIGAELDAVGADVHHRQAWAEALQANS